MAAQSKTLILVMKFRNFEFVLQFLQIVAVHHTRDTFTKEWLDTLDKALRGWTAFLRPMLKSVMHLPCFRADWLTLMGVLQDLITMHTLPSNAGSRKVPYQHKILAFCC